MNTSTKTQRDWLKKALTLATKHPELDIKFCTNSEELTEFRWTCQEIYEIRITEWFETEDGEIVIDRQNIIDHFDNCNLLPDEDSEEWDTEVDRLFSECVKKVICIFTA